MPRKELAGPAAIAPAGTGRPYWRALLESRWQVRLREVTKLSLAYHTAASEPAGSDARAAQALLYRAVAARRELANVEEALGRLAAGTFGACEQCGAQIPAGLLASIPETRYCARCELLSGSKGLAGVQELRIAPRRRGGSDSQLRSMPVPGETTGPSDA